jgi:hypothetical protein
MADNSEHLPDILQEMLEKFSKYLWEQNSAISALAPKITLLATSTHSHIVIMGAAALALSHWPSITDFEVVLDL